jgi:hypothetical protein
MRYLARLDDGVRAAVLSEVFAELVAFHLLGDADAQTTREEAGM